MSEIDHPKYRPRPISAGTAIVAAIIVSGLTALTSAIGGALGLLGTLVVGVGLVRGQQRLGTIGAGVIFIAVLVGGAAGSAPILTILGTVFVVLVYDGGRTAIELGTQIRAAGQTARVELVHLGATTAVSAGVGTLGYLSYTLGAGGQPAAALVALLLAGVFFVWALRPS